MVFDFDIDKAPKTKEFLKELTSFMETLNTPKFIKLQNNKNFDEIENILSKKYQDLFDNNYSLMFSLIRNEIKERNKRLGIVSVEDAKVASKNYNSIYVAVLKQLGIPRRVPTPTETAFIDTWYNTYSFNKNINGKKKRRKH